MTREDQRLIGPFPYNGIMARPVSCWMSRVRSTSRALLATVAAAFIVFGAYDARAFMFCRAKPDGETIRGFFITPERKTRLHLFSNGSDGGCLLRHEGGPTSDALSWTDGAVFVGVCRDQVTGRDWAMVYQAAGQHADLGFWSVDPVTRTVEHEYEEAWTIWGLEEDQYGEVVADGACLARERRAGLALLLEAMLALRPGSASGSEGRDERQFNIPVGTSLKLATRLEKAPELGFDDEGNRTIHAIEGALKALVENRLRTIKLKDSHGFNQFSLAYSRDRITIDGLRMRLSVTRRECNAHILDRFNSEMSKLVTKFIRETKFGPKKDGYVMMDLKIEIDEETYISSDDLKMGRSFAHLPEEIVRMKWEEKFNCSSD